MSNYSQIDQLVAQFDQHDQAQQAIEELGKAKFDMADLSLIGQDYHTEEHPVGYVNVGDRMLSWGKIGAFWGSIWGILFGSAILIVPGVGAVLFGGWIVTTLVAALEGAAIGGGIAALGASLASIGVPKDSVIQYQSAIKAGKFLVIVKGDPDAIKVAKETLATMGAESVEVSEHRTLVGVG